jgi:HEAT repeat protein
MLSQLIDDLNSTEVDLRRKAAEGLSRHESASAAAVSLARASGDPDEQVRQWATAALEEMGAPSVEDAPALAELLAGSNADTAYWAATLLGRLGERAADVVPALARAVDSDGEMAVRQRAAWALGKIGRPAATVAESLRHATAADDPRLARLAKQALETILGE